LIDSLLIQTFPSFVTQTKEGLNDEDIYETIDPPPLVKSMTNPVPASPAQLSLPSISDGGLFEKDLTSSMYVTALTLARNENAEKFQRSSSTFLFFRSFYLVCIPESYKNS
jgi:hypothetical protein